MERNRKAIRWARLIGTCVLCVGTAAAAPSIPQEDATEHAQVPDSNGAFRLIQERRRDLAHPGDPLRLTGAFDEGNDMTSGRGALQRSTFTPVPIDTDEAYGRQLAMLEDRATYIGAYLQASRSEDSPLTKAPARPRPQENDDPSSSLLSWIGALAVVAVGSAALILQGRK